jgi:hypothetical protein
MFSNDRKLAAHVRDRHTFKPKLCPEGCEPAKIYDSQGSLKVHTDRKHSGRCPAACAIPDCPVKTKHPEKYNLTIPITTKHNIDRKEAAEMAAYGYVMKLASELEPKLAQVGKKAKGSSEHDDVSADEGSALKLGDAPKKKCKTWGDSF